MYHAWRLRSKLWQAMQQAVNHSIVLCLALISKLEGNRTEVLQLMSENRYIISILYVCVCVCVCLYMGHLKTYNEEK